MGFSRGLVETALAACNDDLARATDWLLNPPEPGAAAAAANTPPPPSARPKQQSDLELFQRMQSALTRKSQLRAELQRRALTLEERNVLELEIDSLLLDRFSCGRCSRPTNLTEALALK